MPGFMKDVGHAVAALLIQVQTGQLIFAFRMRMRRCGPDKEPRPDATPVFAVASAPDFEAADEIVIGSLWMPTMTVTSWSRSAFIRLMTDCPSRRNLSSLR
jgi:hypothetical protein